MLDIDDVSDDVEQRITDYETARGAAVEWVETHPAVAPLSRIASTPGPSSAVTVDFGLDDPDKDDAVGVKAYGSGNVEIKIRRYSGGRGKKPAALSDNQLNSAVAALSSDLVLDRIREFVEERTARVIDGPAGDLPASEGVDGSDDSDE